MTKFQLEILFGMVFFARIILAHYLQNISTKMFKIVYSESVLDIFHSPQPRGTSQDIYSFNPLFYE